MTIFAELSGLSAAEDIFAHLGVPYDPNVLSVARLHILRRMGDYLRKSSLTELSDEEQREQCQSFLRSAYSDFVRSTPIEERVFKVHKDAVAPKRKGAFVSLEALRKA